MIKKISKHILRFGSILFVVLLWLHCAKNNNELFVEVSSVHFTDTQLVLNETDSLFIKMYLEPIGIINNYSKKQFKLASSDTHITIGTIERIDLTDETIIGKVVGKSGGTTKMTLFVEGTNKKMSIPIRVNAIPKATEALLKSLVLTIDGIDFPLNSFDKFEGHISYEFTNGQVPTKAIIKSIKISQRATSSVQELTELTFTNRKAIITITAEDGKTKNDYTIQFKNKAAELLSFSFLKNENPQMSIRDSEKKDIIGTIQPDHTVTFSETYSAYVFFDKLIPNFTTSEGALVTVLDVEQKSGVTIHDFTTNITYQIKSEDGSTTNTYIVNKPSKERYATIPDANFKTFLQGQFPAAFNANGQLNIANTTILNTSYLNVSSLNISDITGIEFFPALVTFYCEHNTITTLNLGKNPLLSYLYCSDNVLASLDLSNNPELNGLYCSINKLVSLDLRGNPNLSSLECNGNALTSIDISKSIKLNSLLCKSNQLSSLDLSQNKLLTRLDCSDNLLTSLDVSQNNNISEVQCALNRLTYLDIRSITSSKTAAILSLGAGTSINDNPLEVLKVHSSRKQDVLFKTFKTSRGANIKIQHYDYSSTTNTYTAQCCDYNPNLNTCTTNPTSGDCP